MFTVCQQSESCSPGGESRFKDLGVLSSQSECHAYIALQLILKECATSS